MFGWSMHECLVEAHGTHLVFYRNDIPQLFGEFFHRNYDFLFDAWMMRRHREVNSHVYCASAALTWEFAGEGAFQHVIALSPKGKARVNEVPPSPVDYTWGQLGNVFLQRLLPVPLLDRLVRSRRQRRAGGPKALSQPLVDRMICLSCSAGELRLETGRIVCGNCGVIYGQRAGLFDFDAGIVVASA